ncbi:MAG: hypothetical protein RI973_248 [Bacteroidota bacterium]|jgi:hypothetical protein
MIFQELSKTALLGTDNTAFSAELLRAFQEHGIREDQEAARVLAEAAALYSQVRKAGYVFSTYNGELVAQTVEEEKKTCSHQSLNHLRLLLEGGYGFLLPEFFRLLKARGYSFPAQHLAALLLRPDAKKWVPPLLETLGERGRWLLRQHPTWRNFIQMPDVDWYTANLEERLVLLNHVRRHEPAVGLELLAQTWQETPLAERKELIKALQTGLSMVDEPFLECCLDDSRKEIRQLAAGLLSRLPDSRFCERMFQRAAACLSWDGKQLGFHFPDDIGPEADRDGLLRKDQSWKGGEQAAYLGQVCSKVPPGRWESHFNDTPEGVIARMAGTEWFETWFQALAKAVRNLGNDTWVTAMLWQMYRLESSQWWQLDEVPALIAKAKEETLQAMLLQALKQQSGIPGEFSPAFVLLRNCPFPWPEQVSMLLAGRLQEAIGKTILSFYEMGQARVLLRMLGRHGNLTVLPQIQKNWPLERLRYSTWESSLEQMLKTLLFRKEMEAALL